MTRRGGRKIQEDTVGLTAGQIETLLRIDRHVDEVETEMKKRFDELDKVIWKSQNGTPGLVTVVSDLSGKMTSILLWVRAVAIAAVLAFCSTLFLVVAERMAQP